MNTDEAKQLADNALDQLIAALENGQSETLRKYLATMSRFHNYSFGNCMMIAMQRPDATHVAGFHAWLKFQRHVRKGEKGIVILAPMIGRSRTTESDDNREESSKRLIGFRAAHVFDLSQTDGEPLPEFAQVKGSPRHYTSRLKDLIAAKSIELTYSATIGPAKGISSGGAITLLPELEPAEEFAVLAHELAHELLHKDDRRTLTTLTIRETEAEAVAFVVCQAIGLETGSAAADYIQIYNGDKATLCESLTLIQRTATEIITGLSG
jgi:antirestriction protein ArdC